MNRESDSLAFRVKLTCNMDSPHDARLAYEWAMTALRRSERRLNIMIALAVAAIILALNVGCARLSQFVDKFEPGVILNVVTNRVTETTTTNAVVTTNIVAEADFALNPQPSAADLATGQKQECKFKVDNDGHGGDGKSRVVVRWPSFLTHLYDLEKANSYTTIDGMRLEWQKIDDEENNARASFQILRRGDTFPRNSQVYLIVDEKIVAGFVKADCGVYNAKFSLPKRMKDVVK